jgi:CelD/BcsL family acetyltransferase involved in cellulose biosynthesis
VVDDAVVFERFVALHRGSDGDKASFMTAEMEAFFRDLYALPGWGIDALRDGGGTVVAAAFGYVDESGYYLYNSAFDTVLSRVSPGQVMLGTMIERAVEEGRRIFDFLKGDENYKFRLGAEPRPLYDLEVVR